MPRRIFEIYRSLLGFSNGAEGQNRTADTVIFSHVVYPLSYLGTAERSRAKRTGMIPRRANGSRKPVRPHGQCFCPLGRTVILTVRTRPLPSRDTPARTFSAASGTS